MKTLKFLVAVTIFAIIMVGCSALNYPTEPTDKKQDSQPLNLNAMETSSTYDISPSGTWDGEQTYELFESQLALKSLTLGKIATFNTIGSAIIAPDEKAKEVTIKIEAQKWNSCPYFPDGALFFHCNPSGIAFDPPAKIVVDLKELGWVKKQVFHLYYWDEAQKTWIKKSSTNDSTSEKDLIEWNESDYTVTLLIPHFSIWAISDD